jgi:hypothetical protein
MNNRHIINTDVGKNTVFHGDLFSGWSSTGLLNVGVSIIVIDSDVCCIVKLQYTCVSYWAGTSHTELRFYRRRIITQYSYASPPARNTAECAAAGTAVTSQELWVDTSDFSCDPSFATTVLGNKE